MHGTDFLQLSARDIPLMGRASWLADQLREAVLGEVLRAGDRLPPSRVLAEDLGWSRGVVVRAYDLLRDEGLVTGRSRAGTTVLPGVASPHAAGVTRTPSPPNAPGPVLDLSPGLPDLSLFPRAAWLRAERAVLASTDALSLGYGDPAGAVALREELSAWLSRNRGLRCTARDIIVVTGVAQALALLATVLHRRGLRRIGVEDPGSCGAREELAYWGLEPVAVGVDEAGLDVSQLVHEGVEAVVTTPAHQFPTGVVLAPERRRMLIDWARGRDGLVVEDDYDAEHRYDRSPVPALHPRAPDHVAHTGSVSKSLAPGLRLGWLIPPPGLHAELLEAKFASDISSPAIAQQTMARLLADGSHDSHLRRVRRRQRARRDAMVRTLRHLFPDGDVHGVAAGLHLVLTFPGRRFDEARVSAELRDLGIVVDPLSRHRIRSGPPGFVLGYAAHPADLTGTALRRLRDHLDASPATRAPHAPPNGGR